MLEKWMKKYNLIIKFNWSIATVLLGLNFYLYARLPQSVPIHLNEFNQADNLGGKMIIWVFPLIFVTFGFFFKESRIENLSSRPVNSRRLKSGLLVLQLILWGVILRAYFYYFRMI